MEKKLEILDELQKMKTASQNLRTASSVRKNRVLKRLARLLIKREAGILKANSEDLTKLDTSHKDGARFTAAFRDRLTLNSIRIRQMAEGLCAVAKLPDPVGEVVEHRKLKNGLRIRKIRSPLGVLLLIFESRPNVSIEAFALAFKSGNCIILRGGRESMCTTSVLCQIIEEALRIEKFPHRCVWGIGNPDRKITEDLLSQKKFIDVVIPRGGERLIEFVTLHSTIPIIKNDRGLCHIYIHEDANLEMAKEIVMNAKTQRPGVCNAMETLLVHKKIAEKFLQDLHFEMEKNSVEWLVCNRSYKILKNYDKIKIASESSWDHEYLDLIMNCRIVDSLDSAIAHIEKHSSRHSEAIVTRSAKFAKKFQLNIDAAAVYWNASTRFTDGFELGLGGELGISTQKLHVRGPVGLRELTSIRWILDGQGQVRN